MLYIFMIPSIFDSSDLPALSSPPTTYAYNLLFPAMPTYLPMTWEEMDEGPVTLTSTATLTPTLIIRTAVSAPPPFSKFPLGLRVVIFSRSRCYKSFLTKLGVA